MAGKHSAGLIECVDLLHIKEALHRKDRIQSRAAVSFGKNESVAPHFFRVGGIDVHLFIVKDSQCIDDVQRAADMSLAETSDALHCDTARLLGDLVQFLNAVFHGMLLSFMT